MDTKISRLFYYPIKSFRGLETRTLGVDSQGANWDRKWMLVDEKNSFITQRQMPGLAKIGVNLVDDSHIELTQQSELICDFGLLEKESEPLTVKIWKEEAQAFEVSTDVSKDLSRILKKPVRLVRLSDDCTRTGRFSDGEAILVVSEASVRNLEEKAKASLSVVRFRPNIVVSDCAPHAEDEWAAFQVGTLAFRKTEPCTRCRITQVHPLTGVVGEEPLKTLMTYRKLEKGIAFGHYYANDQKGEIRVGESLKIL